MEGSILILATEQARSSTRNFNEKRDEISLPVQTETSLI
jgi:hypothetical protein